MSEWKPMGEPSDQPFGAIYNFEVDHFENFEHVYHAEYGERKPMVESCRKCGAVGDTTGKREIWSDDVVQYLCDDCCKAMGRVRFVMTRKDE